MDVLRLAGHPHLGCLGYQRLAPAAVGPIDTAPAALHLGLTTFTILVLGSATLWDLILRPDSEWSYNLVFGLPFCWLLWSHRLTGD
jgi:hypothetical protein